MSDIIGEEDAGQNKAYKRHRAHSSKHPDVDKCSVFRDAYAI